MWLGAIERVALPVWASFLVSILSKVLLTHDRTMIGLMCSGSSGVYGLVGYGNTYGIFPALWEALVWDVSVVELQEERGVCCRVVEYYKVSDAVGTYSKVVVVEG